MSTPAYTTLSVQKFLMKNSMTSHATPSLSTWSHPPELKKVLKGKCVLSVEVVKQKTAEALKGVKIDELKNWFGFLNIFYWIYY